MTHERDEVFRTLEDIAGIERTINLLHGKRHSGSKKVLILGGGGYLGVTLTRLLMEAGHDVFVLDRFFYGEEPLARLGRSEKLTIYTGDVRDEQLLEDVMRGKDVVINLAAIVGDEACRINPGATWEINVETVGSMAEMAGRLGVERIIQASTCSTYGKNGGELLGEDTVLAPLSLYAESKVASERLLMAGTGGGLSPACCILRLSTLFGYSRRPRFDLVVNTLTGYAWKRGSMTIFGGSQWRPLLHVGDAARAFMKVLEAPREKIAGKIFNTGGEKMNLTIMEIGKMIDNILPRTAVEVQKSITDERDYKVDFSRIKEEIDFEPEYSISNGIMELIHALENDGEMDPDNPVYSNYKWLNGHRELLEPVMEPV